MKRKHAHSVYCIFYIEKDYYTTLNEDLAKRGYGGEIRAIVPTVRILRKVVHGREVYENIPVLFNYGFIRMPREKAMSREFLNKMKKDIRGIRTWLKSPSTLHPRKVKKRVDNMDIFDDFSIVATATKKEVRHIQRVGRKNSRFSTDDIMNIAIGDYIILKGYPYEGVDATILDINHVSKTVKLLLYPQLGRMEISLPFDQVLDTVYSNHDPDNIWRSKVPMVDMASITEEKINGVIEQNQY